MASTDINTEARIIIAARGEDYLRSLGRVSDLYDEWTADNSAALYAVRREAAALAEAARKAEAVATVNTWTKAGGAWVVRLAHPAQPGDTIAVTRRDGTTSTETVVSVDGVIAYVQTASARYTNASTTQQARAAAAAHGIAGEIWD